MSQNRILSIFIFLLIFLFIIFTRLFIIQIFEKDKYIELAERNRIKKFTEIAPRGDIFSSDSVIIAMNKPYYSLYINLDELNTDIKNLSLISKFVNIDIDSLNSLIKSSKIYKQNELCVKTNLDIQAVSFIEEHSSKFPGFFVMQEPRRFYPYKSLYAHVVGYVGNMNKKEYESYKQHGYQYNDFIGKTGLEKYYEKFLKGKNGIKYYEVDARLRKVKELESDKAIERQKGANIYTSLNHKLEKFTDSIFSDYNSGAVIIMDKNARILCMYSKPSFDPNIFIYGINREAWNFLNRNSLSPFLNRSTSGLYPPASIFKLLTALIGLQTKKVEINTHFQSCNGNILISGRVFNCWKAHGELNLYDAIVQSCDVYFYQLGLKIGINDFSEYVKKTMFTRETGIDLYEENSGLFPDEKYLNKKYGKNAWGLGQIANIAIGQGDILVTPIQIALFTNSIINDGEILKPHIVDSVKIDNEIIYKFQKVKTGELPFDKNYFKIIKNAMRDIVNTDKGTAFNIILKKHILAGKTGTAENPHGEPHSWFTGFYPFEDPEIIITVIVENGGHGSESAGKIVKKITEYYIKEYETKE